MSAVRFLAPALLLLAIVATRNTLASRRGPPSSPRDAHGRDLVQASTSNRERRAEKEDDDDKKTLSQQVAEGKYGLIQKELFSGRSRRPGVLSYKSNPEVPRDSAATLGGLAAEEIWLAEDHLLVLRGGSLKDDDAGGGRGPSAPPWPPIDDYQAPPRQVKLPPRPAVAPPFPVRLRDGGPAVFLRSANGTSPQIVTGGFVPLVPWNGTLLVAAGANLSALAGLPTLPVPALPLPGNAAAGSAPFIPVPFPLANGSLVGSPPHHLLQSLPPGAAFLPPPPPNLTEPYDEDDPSIYYPPPYDFYYPKDNTSAVAPGPLVPGIILPPPPDFFGPLEQDEPPVVTTTTTTTPPPPPVRTRRPPSTFVRPSPPLPTDNEVDEPATPSPRPVIGYEYRKPKQDVFRRLKLGQIVKVADSSFDEATTTERTVIIGGSRRPTTQRPTPAQTPSHQLLLLRPRVRPTPPPPPPPPPPPSTPEPYYSDNLVSPAPDPHAIFQFDFRSQRTQRPLPEQDEQPYRQPYRSYQQSFEEVTQTPYYDEPLPPAPRPFSPLRTYSPNPYRYETAPTPSPNPYRYETSTTPPPHPYRYQTPTSSPNPYQYETSTSPNPYRYETSTTPPPHPYRYETPTTSPNPYQYETSTSPNPYRYEQSTTPSPHQYQYETSTPPQNPYRYDAPTTQSPPPPRGYEQAVEVEVTPAPPIHEYHETVSLRRPISTSPPTYRPVPVTSTPVPHVHYYETSSPHDKATFYFYEEPVLTTTARPPTVVNATGYYEYYPVPVSAVPSTTAAPAVPAYLYNTAYRNTPKPPVKSALTYFNGDAQPSGAGSSPRTPVYEFSFQAQSVAQAPPRPPPPPPPQLQGGFKPSAVRPSGAVYNSLSAPPPVYTTANPLYYYTQHDDSVFDDITKKYFSMFGRKLPSDDKLRATTPLPPLTSTQAPAPPQAYSLASDTLVNYRRPLPDVDADSEPIRSVGGGGNAFISYRLPGSGGHFYFLTPQLGPGRSGRRLTVIEAR